MAQTNAPLKTSLTLPSDKEILIERTFHAPRAHVWRAFTDASLLPKWMGPAPHSMTRCEMDLRVGGNFLYVWGAGEDAHRQPGKFVEVDPPRRLVYDDTGDTPARVTLTFTEVQGGTKVALRGLMPSKAVRDEILSSGYSEGMEVCYANLDALLREH